MHSVVSSCSSQIERHVVNQLALAFERQMIKPATRVKLVVYRYQESHHTNAHCRHMRMLGFLGYGVAFFVDTLLIIIIHTYIHAYVHAYIHTYMGKHNNCYNYNVMQVAR